MLEKEEEDFACTSGHFKFSHKFSRIRALYGLRKKTK
jgi:hypothetical protein